MLGDCELKERVRALEVRADSSDKALLLARREFHLWLALAVSVIIAGVTIIVLWR